MTVTGLGQYPEEDNIYIYMYIQICIYIYVCVCVYYRGRSITGVRKQHLCLNNLHMPRRHRVGCLSAFLLPHTVVHVVVK